MRFSQNELRQGQVLMGPSRMNSVGHSKRLLAMALSTLLAGLLAVTGATPAAHAGSATPTLSGKLVDKANSKAGVAGVSVVAWKRGTYQDHAWTYAKTRTVATGSDGRFSFSGLEVGKYKLEFETKLTGYIPTWYAADGSDSFKGGADVLSLANSPVSITGRIARGAVITGKVTSSTGAQLVKPTIVARSATASGEIIREGVVQSDGNYMIAGLRPGDYGLTASADNHHATAYANGAELMVKTRARITNKNVKVAKGSLLTGTLTDSEGVVAAAEICARDSDYQLDCVNSATDGTYALRVVAGEWRVTVDDVRYARAYLGEPAKNVTAVDGKDQAGLDYLLKTPGHIKGTISLQSAPAAVRVSVNYLDYPTTRVGQYLAKSGAEFDVALPAGRYCLTFSSPGYPWQGTGGYGCTEIVIGSAERKSVNATLMKTVTAVKPTILGTPAVGKVLALRTGAWGPTGVKLTHRWSSMALVDTKTATYPVSIRDAGNEVCVYVSGEMAGYLPVYEQSSCVTIPLLTLKSAVPKISGKVKVGKRLAVAPGLWGPAPVILTYRWYRSGKPISKATGKSYLLTKKDKGKKISVEVTGSKTGHKTIAKKSVATKGVS